MQPAGEESWKGLRQGEPLPFPNAGKGSSEGRRPGKVTILPSAMLTRLTKNFAPAWEGHAIRIEAFNPDRCDSPVPIESRLRRGGLQPAVAIEQPLETRVAKWRLVAGNTLRRAVPLHRHQRPG